MARISLPSRNQFVSVVLMFLMLSPLATFAGPLKVDCESTDKRFAGVLFHGPIAANDFHTLGREFASKCGTDKWKVHWVLHEFEKNVNLPDELLFLPMTGTHQVAVPGHGPEDAPNKRSTMLPRMLYFAPVAPDFRMFFIPGRPTLHTLDIDGSVGFLWPFSGNRDILMYFAGLAMYHQRVSEVMYYAAILDPDPSETSGLAGMLLGNPEESEVTLVFAVIGAPKIDKGVLNIAGKDDAIQLDGSRFDSSNGVTTFIDPSLSLQGEKAKAIFVPGGSTLTVHIGDRLIQGDIRLRGELKAEAPERPSEPPVKPEADTSLLLLLVVLAIALAVIALILALVRRRDHRYSENVPESNE